jgi:hypothetical protein
MNTTLAMVRLKTRVNPEIPPAIQRSIRSPITVQVKGRIDEGGNIAVTDVQGTNPSINMAVSTAVEQWKFSPIADANGRRCVETEIPILIQSNASSARP